MIGVSAWVLTGHYDLILLAVDGADIVLSNALVGAGVLPLRVVDLVEQLRRVVAQGNPVLQPSVHRLRNTCDVQQLFISLILPEYKVKTCEWKLLRICSE